MIVVIETFVEVLFCFVLFFFRYNLLHKRNYISLRRE